MTVSHLTPQIALAGGAALVLLLAVFLPRSRQWWTAPVTVVVATVAAWTQADLLLGDVPTITMQGTWAVDGATGWATVAICVMTALTAVLSPEWMATDPRHGEFYVMLLFSALGASLLAGTTDLLLLVVALVLTGLTGVVLAAYHRDSPLSAEAGIKFFLLGALTNVLLLLGAVVLYGLAGTTSYARIAGAVAGADQAALMLVVGLVAVGLALEIGAAPAHAWMPDVAQGAPAPAAAFLTVVPKFGALVALARFVLLLPADLVGWRPLVAVLAAATMTLGNLAALWQDDVRRLLGWSSVSQAGYGLMALVALQRSEVAVGALLFFLFAYGLANLAAFGVVTQLRGRTALGSYAGVGRERPWLGLAMVLALLSLVGIPPLAGFGAKLRLFGATIAAGYGWLAALAVLNTVVSLFYYLRVIAPMWFQAPAGEDVPILGRWAAVATGIAAAGVVVVGLVAEPLLAPLWEARLLP